MTEALVCLNRRRSGQLISARKLRARKEHPSPSRAAQVRVWYGEVAWGHRNLELELKMLSSRLRFMSNRLPKSVLTNPGADPAMETYEIHSA
jgi:hypothetical protein